MYPSKLENLVTKPSHAPNWKGPYVKKGIRKDPWGNDYVYRMPGQQNTTSYDIYSLGPDKQEGTQDDVVNWETKSPF